MTVVACDVWTLERPSNAGQVTVVVARGRLLRGELKSFKVVGPRQSIGWGGLESTQVRSVVAPEV